MPQDALVGTYHENSYNKGDPMWISHIICVEMCKSKYLDQEIVQLISEMG
jgi:hypothetical protein